MSQVGYSVDRKELIGAAATGAALVLVMIIALSVAGQHESRPDAVPVDHFGPELRSAISGIRAKTHLFELTKEPHIAGTAADNATSEYVYQQFLAAGIPQVEVEEYEVLLNLPAGSRASEDGAQVQLRDPTTGAASPTCDFSAALQEAVVPEDPTSSQNHAYPFHGYSPSGDATARLVYANYGREEDYTTLESMGVSVDGAIVICRYGQVFRGNKVWSAQIRGAKAVIVFSDPADDGAARGAVFPEGPYRPESGVQRGSVYLGEGDPMTPGFPATDGGLRLTDAEAHDGGSNGTGAGWALPSIPSIPVSAADAAPLMLNLQAGTGPTAPPNWSGALPGVTTYKLSGGMCHTRVKVTNTFKQSKIWNVLATIRGTVEPDRVVILGNHRDAWVNGGVDPSGGTASLLEAAYGLGAALKKGWKPRRTIILASWDAEEYGLVGSTEFVERRLRALQRTCIGYINIDESVNSLGRIWSEASPVLNPAIYAAAKLVPQPACPPNVDGTTLCHSLDPLPGDSLYDFWLRTAPSTPTAISTDSGSAAPTPEPSVGYLGSGSDYTAFLAHAGVSSVDLRFASVDTSTYGVYHSVYDSFTYVELFAGEKDGALEFHAAAAQLWATAAMHMASSYALQHSYVPYARALTSAAAGLRAQLTSAGGSVAPPSTAAGPTPKTLDLDRLSSVIDSFAVAAVGADVLKEKAEAAVLSQLPSPPQAALFALRDVNDRLMFAERAFVLPEGLPGRRWYRHVIFSPSEFDSYADTTFPGVSDALTAGDWRQAQRMLDAVCHLIDRAAACLNGALIQ